MFLLKNKMVRISTLALNLSYLGFIFLIYQFYHFITNSNIHIDTKIIIHLATYLLSFFAILFFLTSLLHSKGTRDVPRKMFIGMLFLLSGWLISLIGSELTYQSPFLVLWARIPYVFILWIPPTLFSFFFFVLYKRLPSKKALTFLFVFTLFNIVLAQTPLYIRRIETLPNGGQELVTGPLYAYDSIYYFAVIISVILLSIKKWYFLDLNQKRTLKIIVPFYLLAFFPPVITQIILPAVGYSYYYSAFGTLAGILTIVIGTSFAIFREKFLNIKIRIQRRLFLHAITFITTILYLSIVFVVFQVSKLFSIDRNNILLLITQNISSFALLIALILFATYLILKKQENNAQRTFIVLILSVITSLFGVIMSSIAPTSQVAFWERSVYIGAGWIPSLIFLLFYFYVSNKKLSWKILLAIIVPAITLVLLGQSSLIVMGVTQVAPFSFRDIPGPMYSIEALYYPASFIAVAYVILKNWNTIPTEKRQQIRLLFLGYAVSILPPLIINVILHNFFDLSRYYQLTFNIGIFTFIGVTASAIFNYKLLGFKIRISPDLVRKLLAAVLVIFVLPLLIWLLFVKQYFPQNTIGRMISIFFIVFALYPLFNRLLKNFINRTIFKNTKTPVEIINHIIERISTTANANLIITVLLRELNTQLNLGGAAYFAKTRDHFKLLKEVNYPEVRGVTEIASEEKIMKVLIKENSYTPETLNQYSQAKGFVKILEEANTEVIVPFKIENKIVGLLVLKEKKHNEAFSKDDLHILDTLSFHLATTIHNAFLFAKVKNFARTLQKKVDNATQELKDKNDELAKIQKEKSQFFADIAHEFKTPITVLQGNVDTAASRLPQEELTALQTEIQRMNQLTTNLLELSQAESGNITLSLKSVNIVELIQEVLQEVNKFVESKEILICLDLPESLTITCDQNRIRQIILNLLTNATKYNKERGRINIQLTEKDSNICLTVSDTGIGIPKEDVSKIFQRFYRADKAYSKKLGGTGLGLAIVKLMTELHGGTVNVESEESKGTKFTICLPKSPKLDK